MMYMLEVFQFTAISLKMTIPFIAADVSSQISCSVAFQAECLCLVIWEKLHFALGVKV